MRWASLSAMLASPSHSLAYPFLSLSLSLILSLCSILFPPLYRTNSCNSERPRRAHTLRKGGEPSWRYTRETFLSPAVESGNREVTSVTAPFSRLFPTDVTSFWGIDGVCNSFLGKIDPPFVDTRRSKLNCHGGGFCRDTRFLRQIEAWKFVPSFLLVDPREVFECYSEFFFFFFHCSDRDARNSDNWLLIVETVLLQARTETNRALNTIREHQRHASNLLLHELFIFTIAIFVFTR